MEIGSIAVFGGMDPVGERVIDAALTKGMRVRVLVNESELKDLSAKRRPGLDLVMGDVLDVAAVKTTLEGQHAAVITLGASGVPANSFRDYSEAMKNIVAAMESLNIRCISASLPVALQVGDRQKALLPLESSELLWVIASTHGVTKQENPSGYLVRRSGLKHHYTKTYTSAADLAEFLLDSLVMPELYQKTVEVFSRPDNVKQHASHK